jgi:hypothetical protein
MASSRSWPFDDEDRPSGSVRPLSQADLQAILVHLTSEDPDGLLAGTIADRPVVAVRVRASVGRPGGSAQARWRRARAAEWAAWTRTLPWRVAATVGIGAAGGLLGKLLVGPRLGLVLGALAAAAAAWGLRFKPSPDAVAWRQGAAGERRTARLLAPLERQGWAILHDLALSGSRANLDHLVIGPGGVFVIDSKQYRGRLRLDAVGKLWQAWPPSPRPDTGSGVVGGRPGRPGPAPTQGWPWCRSWPSTAPRSPGARWSPTACRSWRPSACQACFSPSRRCWDPSGSPGWPTRPGSASTPPANLFHSQGLQVGQRESSSCLPMRTREAAVTASRRSARPRSWRIFSLCHLHGIQMPLCRAFDFGLA